MNSTQKGTIGFCGKETLKYTQSETVKLRTAMGNDAKDVEKLRRQKIVKGSNENQQPDQTRQ